MNYKIPFYYSLSLDFCPVDFVGLVVFITSRIILYQQFLQTSALSVASNTCCHGLNLFPQCGQDSGILAGSVFCNSFLRFILHQVGFKIIPLFSCPFILITIGFLKRICLVNILVSTAGCLRSQSQSTNESSCAYFTVKYPIINEVMF